MNKTTEITLTQRINNKQPYRWASVTVRNGVPENVTFTGSIADGNAQHFDIEYDDIQGLQQTIAQIVEEVEALKK